MRTDQLSIGWRAHLVAERYGAELHEHDACVVLRTPSNPHYYWGNCLIVRAAPRDPDLAHWLARFDAGITKLQPASQHVAIGIDAPLSPEPLPGWQAAGFELVESTVLVLGPGGLQPGPSPKAGDVSLRPLRLPEEAPLAVAMQCECNEHGYETEGFRLFRQRKMVHATAMQEQGKGAWFGAFVAGALIADCGLSHDGPLGTFSDVETHPRWRRRGLARSLVHHVCRHAFESLGLQQLVISADPDDVAIAIYRALGFTEVETQWQLQRRAPQDC